MKTDRFTIDNPLPPLWLAYPEIPQYSIGWRMGYGEDYRWLFNDWFTDLSEEEQAKYREMFPTPYSWQGYYEYAFDKKDIYSLGDIDFWQPDGVPEFSLEQLRAEVTNGKEFDYLFFWGYHKKAEISKSCLSQWWQTSFRIDINEYCCMEQYMMAEKARLFEDGDTRKQILDEIDPQMIKALGRKVEGFEQSVWDKYKYSIVLNGNYAKFIQNQDQLDFLLGTGDKVLVEASPYDTIWGIGMQETDPQVHNPLLWKGENLLGFALMEVRNELRRVLKSWHLIDWEQLEDIID
ncbi:NADAR family protein [Bacteroides acidifaciens]|uniref:NADAR family protein n=1 Tax=Bacteroides acidifaciens TaxID=85831 RepID=UPI00158EC091|nr:NADAR family protein [Bacteroides acidifaciens]